MKENTESLDYLRNQIEDQALHIQYVCRQIVEDCQAGRHFDVYARNKAISGALAGDAALLGILIDRYVERQKGEAHGREN